MRRVILEYETDFEGWRAQARDLLGDGIPPEDVVWTVGTASNDLFGNLVRDAPPRKPGTARVPRTFLSETQRAICHRDPTRFDLLYRLLWRLQRTPNLLANAVDDDVHRLDRLTKAIRRDVHKMHAFVRFRAVTREADETFVAWFEPEHRITEIAAPFFMRRFANMRWSILTPDRCAHWDCKQLVFTDGTDASEAPQGDELEGLWRGYYRSIFNPARLKVSAMTSEMPKKYWKNLPEAELIAPLIAEARTMELRMVDAAPTIPKRLANYDFAPPSVSPEDALESLHRKAAACELCDHACHATQTVFGEGPADAALMIVGEQPGDREDIAGRPLVGPAGEVFDAALQEVGLDRSTLYVTNAVKHFRFTPKGKRRLHQAPRVGHIDHCRWWLEAERRLIKPRLTLAMGATAIRALHGKAMKVETARQGGFTCFDGGHALASLHPSAVLRQATPAEKDQAFASLVDDLTRAKLLLNDTTRSSPLDTGAAMDDRTESLHRPAPVPYPAEN